MITIVYTLQDGRVRGLRFEDPAVAGAFAEQVERTGGLASVVRNGRVLRQPGRLSSTARTLERAAGARTETTCI